MVQKLPLRNFYRSSSSSNAEQVCETNSAKTFLQQQFIRKGIVMSCSFHTEKWLWVLEISTGEQSLYSYSVDPRYERKFFAGWIVPLFHSEGTRKRIHCTTLQSSIRLRIACLSQNATFLVLSPVLVQKNRSSAEGSPSAESFQEQNLYLPAGVSQNQSYGVISTLWFCDRAVQ